MERHDQGKESNSALRWKRPRQEKNSKHRLWLERLQQYTKSCGSKSTSFKSQVWGFNSNLLWFNPEARSARSSSSPYLLNAVGGKNVRINIKEQRSQFWALRHAIFASLCFAFFVTKKQLEPKIRYHNHYSWLLTGFKNWIIKKVADPISILSPLFSAINPFMNQILPSNSNSLSGLCYHAPQAWLNTFVW